MGRKQHRVTLIPGDGTGPELCGVVKDVLRAAGVRIVWDAVEAGGGVVEKYGTPLPSHVLDSIRRTHVALKGPITTPIGTGFRSVNVALRRELDLYASVRPCRSYVGLGSRYRPIDVVLIRENTEDLYAGVEFAAGSREAEQIVAMGAGKIAAHSAISIKPISAKATKRIARYAFEFALTHKRRKVTAVTKANIMKFTDGLFLEVARKVATSYEGTIEYEECLVDSMCLQLVQQPEFYDVILLPNLYGDILSDLCAGLVGGLGMAPGANMGESDAVFEAAHGSAPSLKGLNKANPTALLLSAALMLDHLDERNAAQRLREAIADVIREGKALTFDLGGTAGTCEMGYAVIEKLVRSC
ncbi:MAG: isocitrate dehydrogenase [Candidatus Omnitrophica bacterium CG11_big_fil_rev_8_21_14_0_20_63_9]|nr:MAG: isocitrate dehydrogenase [Candidatus Omnitrophica bacterium CG11_big_fil_rev_8_21_14_0_20_63_9]